jgi:hypothetical protein
MPSPRHYTLSANAFLAQNSYGPEMIAPASTQNPSTAGAQRYRRAARDTTGETSVAGRQSYWTKPPYAAAMLWCFLYKQCGGMADGVEDPAAGTEVIRRALTALYSGEIVDVASSTDLVAHLPGNMDRALAGAPCSFQTWEEALAHLAHAIYALRLAAGRCTAPGLPAGCGFYDPNGLYADPPVEIVTYAGADQTISGAIPSSFCMAFVDVLLDPVADVQPLTIESAGVPWAEAEFRVQLWKLINAGAGSRPRCIPAQLTATEVLASPDADSRLVVTIPNIDVSTFDRMGLIITRVDAKETADPDGEYTLWLRPCPDGTDWGSGGWLARPDRG